MIYVRVQYPENKFGKILMVLYIIGVIIYMIWMTISIVTYIDGIRNYQGSGAFG